MAKDDLYLEELFTDRRVGSIQRLTPVDAQGQPDTSRATLYMGQTQLMTRAGPLPLNFEIPAQSLEEAVDRFADGANKAIEETVSRMEEMRREAASSIIVPGAEGAGGNIKMP
ncbi:MAG TPA: hypothetical protein ENK16_01895 [Chromatiales bacterium]|nr:hypothetical protein [Chromatiales bacterium]